VGSSPTVGVPFYFSAAQAQLKLINQIN